ncbi:unnamed protein product, partial [Trichogramma brassicae]
MNSYDDRVRLSALRKRCEDCERCQVMRMNLYEYRSRANAAAELTEYGRDRVLRLRRTGLTASCRTDSDHGVQPDRGVRLIRHDVALRIES